MNESTFHLARMVAALNRSVNQRGDGAMLRFDASSDQPEETGHRFFRRLLSSPSLARVDPNNSLDQLFTAIEAYGDITEQVRTESRAHMEAIAGLLAQPMFRDRKELVNAPDHQGHTALSKAVRYGQYGVARLLIEEGADACDGEPTNAPLLDVFCSAARRGPARAFCFARWLCERLERQGKRESMARVFRARPIAFITCIGPKQQVEMLDVLLRYGADPNHRVRGWTALHYVAKQGYTSLADALIRHGASVHSAKCDGMSPLHLAAINGHTQMTILLLRHGASDLMRCNEIDEAPQLSDCVPSQAAFLLRHNGIAMTIREWHIWHPSDEPPSQPAAES